MAKKVLTENREGMTQLAELLLEREVVFTEDVERIFGKRKKDILREQKEAEQKAKSEAAASEQPSEKPAEEAKSEDEHPATSAQ